MNVTSRNHRLPRRTFLRGVGALLPLPFLNLMEGASKDSDKPPLRFMTLFKPNGVHPPSWNIGGGTEYDFRMSPLMQPFASIGRFLILDNIGDFGFSSHANLRGVFYVVIAIIVLPLPIKLLRQDRQ